MKKIRLTFLPLFAGMTAVLSLAAASAQDDIFVSNNGNNTVSELQGGTVIDTYSVGLSGPTGVALDPFGDLFVANTYTGTVQEFLADGTPVSTPLATGLSSPRGLVYDGTTGDLYVANQSAGTVDQITLAGTVTTLASGLNTPNGLAVDANGNIYVSNGGSNSITEITPTGTVSTFATTGNDNPNGLAFGPNGNLFVVEKGDSTVEEFNPNGTPDIAYVTSGLDGPEGLAFDSEGNLYVTNSLNNTVTEYPAGGGAIVYSTDLNYPCYITTETGTSITNTVPEPSTYALLIAGLGVLLFMSRRKLARA